jgi:hypothetical protein
VVNKDGKRKNVVVGAVLAVSEDGTVVAKVRSGR